MIILPDDYFDYDQYLPISNKIADFALDYKRLVETGVLCRSKFARLFDSVSIKTGERFDINCKSWRCEKHRVQWGNKWGMTLEERLKTMKIDLLVNLTTSEMVDNITLFHALRRFMMKFRIRFGPTEYLKVVEYNKLHTQPHFHLLISCEEMQLGTMPGKYRTEDFRGLSWPFPIYEFIKKTWSEAVLYYAPKTKEITQVWCQPPDNSTASAKYAIGYVTGTSKNEEPDSTWKGRKLTYSKKFFIIPASEMYKNILIKLFGERDPEDKFFWLPNDLERLPGESPEIFKNCAIMKERYFEAEFYSEHGFFPIKVEPMNFDPVYFDLMDRDNDYNQEYFNSV